VPTSNTVAPSIGDRNPAMTCSWVAASSRPIGPLNRAASKVSAIRGSAYAE
jgi:hypothetical protein